MARLSSLVLTVCLAGCVHRVEAPALATAKSVRLLTAAPERETTQLTQLRTDLEVDTDAERTPHVVATGETGLLVAEGAEVTLAGDEAGTKGFEVDNFVLVEVVLPDGAISNRVVIGYVNGVSLGKERIDLLGRRAFAHEAKEISLTSAVPEHGSFRLRATALDTGGVGRVSDLFVIVTPRRSEGGDDLR